LPEGRKNYTKTQPLQFDEFADCIAWWQNRKENDRAWSIPIDQVLKYDEETRLASVNLAPKNPNGSADFEHLPPEQLIQDIIAKERKILSLLEEINNGILSSI
jgi:type I restriction enzyme M protein